MDCPQCRRECGQNDKFCSECGYRLCSARTPVTELSVPGKETGDSTDVSSADLSRVRRNSIDWTRPNLDLQPRTECTATVSPEMEEGVLNNATPKTSNRNSNRQEGPEHQVSESQVHSDDHTHAQSLGHPDTGSSEDEEKVFEHAVEYLEDEAKEPEDSKESVSASKDEIISKEPSGPGRVEATDVKTRSVTLCWERPVSMEGVSHEIHITYSCEGQKPRLQKCAPNTTTAVLTDLRPGMEYTFNLTAVLPNGICSRTSSTCIQTRKKITMATSSQIPEVTKGLTTAAECWEDTKLLMQPYANWEEYLTPAPMSIAILAELVFISSNTDFSIRKGGPEGGFKYIKYPDSFRACLMQVCNSGWRAFNDAHKNMDQIRLYTNNVPNYIKLAVKILLQDDDNLVQTMLPDQLDNISNIADECVNLAQSTEKRFTDVIELIQELLETCTSAKQVYGNELEEVRKKIQENELRKKAAEEATSRAEQAYKNMNQQLKEAQESFKSAMDSMPSGWEMIGMNFVEGLAGSVTTALSGIASIITLPVSLPAKIAGAIAGAVKPGADNDQISANNIYSKSPQILSLVKGLDFFFDGDQIKWSEIVDQKTKLPKTNWTKEQFEKIQEAIKKEKECKPKMEALGICTKAITICSELGKVKPEEQPDDAITKQIVELIKSLRKDVMVFDTESKSATNTSAFNVNPPQISQTQENSSGSKSAGQIAADNARFKIEQSKAQLKDARELYEKHFNNMEEKKKELTEILVSLRTCAVKEIDFTTTIKILAQGLEAMGNVKDQWQKLIRFFQMVSNLIKTCLGTSLNDFVKTGEKASNKTFKYTSRMFLKDIIYNQAFYASNIASLVNMIAGTYTDVSNKYLMDAVSKLSKLMSLDVNKPEFISERENMVMTCDQAEEGIRNLVKKNKQDFERKTMQRLEKIESELMAVLPPVSEEKKKEIQEAVHKASKNDDDDDQY